MCEVGWRGVDCGVSAAAVGAAARRCTHGGARARSGIFVSGSTLPVAASVPTPPILSRYGADARDCAGTAVATIDPGRNDLYTGLDVFLLRLLTDSHARALAERCAAITWAPLYGLRLHSNLDGGVWARLAALAASRRLPIAAGAAPRLHEVPLDVGVCGLPQVGSRVLPNRGPRARADPQALSPTLTTDPTTARAYPSLQPQGLFWPGDVVLVHWGQLDCFLPDVHYVVVPPGTRHDLTLERCAASPAAAYLATGPNGSDAAAAATTPYGSDAAAAAATPYGSDAGGVIANANRQRGARHRRGCSPSRWRPSNAPLVHAARATYNVTDELLHTPRRRVLSGCAGRKRKRPLGRALKAPS